MQWTLLQVMDPELIQQRIIRDPVRAQRQIPAAAIHRPAILLILAAVVVPVVDAGMDVPYPSLKPICSLELDFWVYT